MRHQVLGFSLPQTLFHGTLNTHQTCAELVFSQFADTTNSTVTQVIDVIDFAVAVAQVNENLDYGQDVVVLKHHGAFHFGTANTAVEFHATHTRQIVGVFAVEQSVEQHFNCFFRGRLAWTHHAVDGNACRGLVCCFVSAQRLRNVSAVIQFVGEDGFNHFHACVTDFAHDFFGDFVVGRGHNFASAAINNVLGQGAANQEIFRHGNFLQASRFNITNVLGIDTLVFLNQNLARFVDDVKLCDFAFQTRSDQIHGCAFGFDFELVEFKEGGQDLLVVHADGFEQNRDWHLATTVYTEIQDVFGIKFEIEPRATIRNDTGREQQLA